MPHGQLNPRPTRLVPFWCTPADQCAAASLANNRVPPAYKSPAVSAAAMAGIRRTVQRRRERREGGGGGGGEREIQTDRRRA